MIKHSVGIRGLGVWVPEETRNAAWLAAQTGISEDVIREKFGVDHLHKAGPDDHSSTMGVRAAQAALDDAELTAGDIDVLIYCGSEHKDHIVWSCAARIQHLLGASNAWATEIYSLCSGGVVSLKVIKDMLLADSRLQRALLVAATRESDRINYKNERSRFMFNFGDGAAACVLEKDYPQNQVGEAAIITDGAFSLDVVIPAGGSQLPPDLETVIADQHYLDVPDPVGMKERLDRLSRENFFRVIDESLAASGHRSADVDFLALVHMKRSMHEAILRHLGMGPQNSFYLEGYGHMQACDQIVVLKEARQRGLLSVGDVVVLSAAGTGYTWAAITVNWG